MHLPGSDAILGLLLGLLGWQQVELIQNPAVHIFTLQHT